MNITWKNCIRIGVSVFILFLAIYYWQSVAGFISLAFNATMPIFIGLAIAYVLNILMSFYERHYFTKFKGKKIVEKSRRSVCIVASILTLVGIVALIFYLVIPELVSCIKFLGEKIPPMIEEFLGNKWVKETLPKDILTKLKAINWMQYISKLIQSISTGLGNAVSVVAIALTSFVSKIITVFISIIFSIYLLHGKNNFQNQGLKLLKRYIPEKFIKKIMYVLSLLNESFHKFIVGQCTEAVILGSLCAICMVIFRFPYAGMIGALVGFCALIPVVGAFLGAGIGAIMMLTESPLTALLFLIFFVLLQQFEGNLIYPRVVGKSIGLPAIWVLAAVTIGGSIMGVLGMLLGVPITATIYRLLREDVNKENDNPITKSEAESK